MEQFDVHSGSFADHPYPVLNRLREERPVFWHDALQGYMLTRYADVMSGLNDESLFLPELPPEPQPHRRHLLRMNGEEHTAFRGLLTPAFAVKALRETIEPRLPEIATSLIDTFVRDGTVDLVRSFCNPYPPIVIRALFGVPDFDALALMEAVEVSLEYAADPSNPVLREPGRAAQARIREFTFGLVNQDRRNPGGGLLTTLREATVDGRQLNDEELANFARLVCVAGVETTQRLIANLIYAVCSRQLDLAVVAADRTLLSSAIDETLRFYPPNHFRIRYARVDTTLHGHTIPAGSKVYVMTGGANRDPRVFQNADTFVIDRYLSLRREAPHLSFGWGAHYCLGAFLAKMETEHALLALNARLPNLRLTPGAQVRFAGFRNRSPVSLPLLFDPVPAGIAG